MTTHRVIIDALANSASAGDAVVLATVVRVTGSSYGGVGARMVVRVDGTTIGIVSGGCLETDLALHARQVHESGIPKVVTYDTRADDDAAWGLGLGCNGLIDVLLEPLQPAAAGALAVLLQQALSASESSVLATVTAGSASDGPAPASHALFCGDTIETTNGWGNRSVLTLVKQDIPEAKAERRRGLVRDYDGVSVSFEVINPAVRLVVCGSGPDVVPLVRIGSELGWDITVVDHRPVEHAHPERFPGARVVECADSSKLAECVALTDHVAAVVMSHHFERDTEYVRALLESPARYVGVLGPRARAERMLEAMRGNGFTPVTDNRMFAPIGIDIGAEGPDAIALSIIAEVSTVMTGRDGGHLKNRAGPLHASHSVQSSS